MSKKQKKTSQKYQVLIALLTVLTILVLVGQFSTILSKYSIQLPADVYTEDHSSNVACDIGYRIDHEQVLKEENLMGWPVIQSTGVLSTDIVPACVGDVRLASNWGRMINLSLLVVFISVGAVATSYQIRYKK